MTIREQAVLVCAIAASAEWAPLQPDQIVREQELLPEAGMLAEAAWERVLTSSIREGDMLECRRQDWAEAECLLREGWTP